MATKKRVVYRVVPRRKGGWYIRTPAMERYERPTKKQAVELARMWARRQWEVHGHPTQLVIWRRDGTIQTEHTYGHDPKRTVG